MSKENEMAKFKDEDEIQPAASSPRSPADQRRDNNIHVLDEYVETHEQAAKESRNT